MNITIQVRLPAGSRVDLCESAFGELVPHVTMLIEKEVTSVTFAQVERTACDPEDLIVAIYTPEELAK